MSIIILKDSPFAGIAIDNPSAFFLVNGNSGVTFGCVLQAKSCQSAIPALAGLSVAITNAALEMLWCFLSEF